MDAFEGGVDLRPLSIVYAEFSLSHGNSGGELGPTCRRDRRLP